MFTLKKKKTEIKQDFPKTCCCMICWWITMYHKVPVEDRHPQLAWLQSSVPTCFFKKKASSSTSLGTCGVRIKSVAITLPLYYFLLLIFTADVKKRCLRSPKAIQHLHISMGDLVCTMVLLLQHLMQICILNPSVTLHSPSIKDCSQVNSSQEQLFMDSIQYDRNLRLLTSWHW